MSNAFLKYLSNFVVHLGVIIHQHSEAVKIKQVSYFKVANIHG